ncbi:hypothetical protein [Spirosoma sordidisoli]|uniref:hypothetical protein n=1 Tax=Spirosoma sordidisoli TaxID=2502893 RepID=UPI0013EBC2E7|nr:hypothetical protein [Spirosoma sordidisoli]
MSRIRPRYDSLVTRQAYFDSFVTDVRSAMKGWCKRRKVEKVLKRVESYSAH